MQKWIGVGRIDGEPRVTKFGSRDVILMWLNCQRSWSIGSDNIPVIFIGKRRGYLNQIKGKKSGCLVYVMGELMTKTHLNISNKKKLTIGTCVLATAFEVWDLDNIQGTLTKDKPNNESIFSEEELKELEEMEIDNG